MPKFNFDYIEQLKRKVKSENERHKIIGLAVYLGSYTARENLAPKGYFSKRREITSRIQEAIHIAEEQENVLRLLDKNSPDEVISNLERAISTISKRDSLPESELSRCIKHLEVGKEPYTTIGKRVEKRLTNPANSKKYIEYKNSPDDRAFSNIFLEEEEVIRQAIVYELKL